MPFSKDTLDFLFENKLHDSREWFRAHHDQYEALVIRPLKELVCVLSPVMLEMDERFIVEPRVDKTICRIWRDTRYTRDPSLYRDHMWISFRRGGALVGQDYPGAYFEIGQYGFSYGCGFFQASTAFMRTLRGMVLEDSPEYLAAERAYRGQGVFRMDGDCYKKPHFAEQPPEKQDWLERRSVSFNAESRDFGLLFSPDLADRLTEDLRALIPVYRFLLAAAEKTLQEKTAEQLLQR